MLLVNVRICLMNWRNVWEENFLGTISTITIKALGICDSKMKGKNQQPKTDTIETGKAKNTASTNSNKKQITCSIISKRPEKKAVWRFFRRANNYFHVLMNRTHVHRRVSYCLIWPSDAMLFDAGPSQRLLDRAKHAFVECKGKQVKFSSSKSTRSPAAYCFSNDVSVWVAPAFIKSNGHQRLNLFGGLSSKLHVRAMTWLPLTTYRRRWCSMAQWDHAHLVCITRNLITPTANQRQSQSFCKIKRFSWKRFTAAYWGSSCGFISSVPSQRGKKYCEQLVQKTYCVLHLRAYFAALPTYPPECLHRVWSRNGREGCSVMLHDVITQMVYRSKPKSDSFKRAPRLQKSRSCFIDYVNIVLLQRVGSLAFSIPLDWMHMCCEQEKCRLTL